MYVVQFTQVPDEPVNDSKGRKNTSDLSHSISFLRCNCLERRMKHNEDERETKKKSFRHQKSIGVLFG